MVVAAVGVVNVDVLAIGDENVRRTVKDVGQKKKKSSVSFYIYITIFIYSVPFYKTKREKFFTSSST